MDVNLFVFVWCTGFDLKKIQQTIATNMDPKLTVNLTYLFLMVTLAFLSVVQETVIIGDHNKYCLSKAN